MPTVRNQQVCFNRLILSNVRSFGEEQRLEMMDAKGGPAQWTLILGDNGVGKTTLLQCLASMCPVPDIPTRCPKAGISPLPRQRG
jgi:ABC-type transport system involved in cytochrome c biogenesis ATPase subunit